MEPSNKRKFEKIVAADTDKIIDLYNYKAYKILFDHHPDIIFTMDLCGNILSVNKRVDKLGYQPDEIKGTFINYIDKPNAKETILKFEEAIKGNPQISDISLLHKEGRYIDFNIHTIPIIENDQVIGVFGIAKDTSEINNTLSRFNFAQEAANVGTWEKDIVTGKAIWSKQVFRILGMIQEGEQSPDFDKFLDIVHPNDCNRVQKYVNRALKENRSYQIEYRILRTDGQERILYEKGDVVFDEKNNPIKLLGIINDITDRKLAEEKLKESEEQSHNIYNNLDVGIWSQDLKTNKMEFLSKGFEKICGYTTAEMIEESFLWENIIFEEDLPHYDSRQDDFKKGLSFHQQYRIVHADGMIRWVQSYTIPVIDSEGKLIKLNGIVSDITDQKLTEEKMHYLAHHDYLTDLPNKRLFEQKLTELIGRNKKTKGEKFALAYLDIDGFKRINDSMGHLIGDEVLKGIAERIKILLTEDQFAARLSGDEFVIILSNLTESSKLIDLGTMILDLFKKPFLIKEYELYITSSIGISIFPNDGLDPETLIRNADAALYRAKELGKDNFQIYQSSKKLITQKPWLLEQDIRNALINNEFRIFYQPRYEMASNRIVSAEALIRWEHPKLGMIFPGDFIPLAEETGLIIDIGNWVIKNISQLIKSWEHHSFRVVPISINLSSKSFLKYNWRNTLSEIIEETGVNPKFLEFEITETTIMKNEKVVLKTVDFVKDLGIKLSLDDFGTGYSSITHLKNFNFDFIKIDRSFIQSAIMNEQDAALTKSIIDLAHGLNMDVVAEGIETPEQYELMKRFGCDQGQGYLMSKPVNLNDFEWLLNKSLSREF